MASLALMVSLILLLMILIGPTVYLLAWIRIIPNFIIFILAPISIIAGLWFIFLPLGMIQFLGLFPVVLGITAINIRLERIKKDKIK